jgi:hypothetical protein
LRFNLSFFILGGCFGKSSCGYNNRVGSKRPFNGDTTPQQSGD